MTIHKSSWKAHGVATMLAITVSFAGAGAARAQFGDLLKKAEKGKAQAEKAQQAMAPMKVDEEKDLGREVAAKLIAYFGLIDNEPLTRYVNMVGATVAAQSERQAVPYRFAILDSNSINAFSTPGGFIFITRGALALCEDESELAGVLGHEVGHVSGRHVLKIFERDKAMRAGMDEAGSRMPGSKYLEDFSKKILVKVIDQGLAPGDEFDADQRGVRYARAAGYPADGLSRFLAKFGQASEKGSKSFWTRTHPPTNERTQRLGVYTTAQGWDDYSQPKLAERYTTETKEVRGSSLSL
jgi:predicted Zn-dependent protease